MASLIAAVQNGPFTLTRIQKNVIARAERTLLDWLCARLPLWVTPDLLTLFGVCGSILVLLSYILSRGNPIFLWVASFGFVVHWFGDSLDGSLARHRRIERPIYGYFLDHTVDAFCNLLMMVGIGLTQFVRLDVALFALIGYYLLCIYVFINNHLSGVFKLSFLGIGPTELRLGLIGINIWIYFCGRTGFHIGNEFVSQYDALLLLVGFGFTGVFMVHTLTGIRALRDPARSGAPTKTVILPTTAIAAKRPVQSASRNVSSAAK